LLQKRKFLLHWRADGGMVGLDSPVEGSHTRADRGVRPRAFYGSAAYPTRRDVEDAVPYG